MENGSAWASLVRRPHPASRRLQYCEGLGTRLGPRRGWSLRCHREGILSTVMHRVSWRHYLCLNPKRVWKDSGEDVTLPLHPARVVLPRYVAARWQVQVCQLFMRSRTQQNESGILADWNLRSLARPSRCGKVQLHTQWRTACRI